MWYKDLTEHMKLISPIPEIRPLLAAYYAQKKRTLLAPLYSMLHYSYSMTLKDVTIDLTYPTKPDCLRVLESDVEGPIAIHEVGLNKAKPELFESFLSDTYISSFQKSISKFKQNIKDETKGEIRHLRVPALNVDAVWLHDEINGSDEFVKVVTFKEEQELYNGKDFQIILNELKKKFGKIEGTMGA